MSVADSPFAGPVSPSSPESRAPSPAWWARCEGMLDRASEILNPILVKEARQALKSKQFSITFSLLLACGWAWSVLGVALLAPGVYYAPGGYFMLVGYYCVLVVPLLVVVPFSAFRSLASESEEGTFELLSITALSSRQIVTGKLGSAVLQMLIYFSALAPCIAFTYLLRGIDILTIVLLLVYTFLASLLLSSVGLLTATLSRSRHWQVVLSVLLLMLLLGACGVWTLSLIQLLTYVAAAIYEPDFWIVHAAVLLFYVSQVTLLVMAAAGQLSFASENRSTPLRIIMLVQQTLWMGWMTYAWLRVSDESVLLTMVGLAAVYWFLMGALLSGETAQLSPRAKRALPQSLLGRLAFTWFNPGSGTGYTFAVLNLAVVGMLAVALGFAGEMAGVQNLRGPEWIWFTCVAWGYVTAYLGIGRLLVLLARRLGKASPLLAFLLQIFLALVGAAAPTFGQAYAQGYARLDYSPLQLSNWAWTLAEIVDGATPAATTVVGLAVVGGAVGILLVNLLFTAGEVHQVRVAAPARVEQDQGDG